MKYTAYRKRTETDVFFTPDAGSSAYAGRPDEMIRFVEDATCMDPSLWALFVAQFRIGNTDDCAGHDIARTDGLKGAFQFTLKVFHG